MNHPCLSCGACCSYFRVSFYWTETEENSFKVPIETTSKVNSYYLAMKGTELLDPRCEQLSGQIGQAVFCQIYDNRPSPCRDFEASFENGQPNDRCDKARLAKGLKPLDRSDWNF